MRPPIIPSYPQHVAASDSEAAPDFKAEDCRATSTARRPGMDAPHWAAPHFTTLATLKSLLLTLLLGTTLPTQAQQYPIQATIQLIPPYSVYLSDYANERLAVQLQLRDLSKGEIPVRLRWQIRGAGISLETKTTYLPPANTVGIGIPLRLNGYDLAPYLRPENLLGSGVGASWRRNAQLPEGLYTFCVQVLDDVTGTVVSNTACATAWLLRHDPPLLNLPEADAQPEARDPQQLTFQWTPRHTGRPNATFQTEYDFRLVEIWPANRNPNDAMLSSVPLYETTTSTTMLVYGPAEPPLVPGRRYAWQVRARSLVNGESLDMFNNQGYSEVRRFQWGNACLTLPDVQAEALTGGRIRLRWEAPPTHSRYRVQYRQQGTTRWYEQETFQPEVILTRLSPNTAYEYQVGGYCGSIAAELTRLASISTLEETVPEYACGLPVPATNQEATAPLPILMVGDMIQAGDFPVTVTESSGQQGQFSGKGTVSLPWLRESMAQVTFQDVQINEHYQLTAGQLTVNGVVMEVVPGELTQPLYDMAVQAERALEQLPSTTPTDTIMVEGEVAKVYLNERGQIIAVDPDGNEVVVAEKAPQKGQTIAVQDSQGNSHTVNATSNGGRGNQASNLPNATQEKDRASVDFTVQFQANEQQVYGFDQKQHDALAADYVQAPINNENYWIAWKSVASGRTDPVSTVAIPRDTFPASVRFRTLTGPTTAQPSTIASERQLSVVGTTHEAVEALTAYVTEQDTAGNETEITVGQLNVISYDELRQKLVVIPVNEATAPNAILLSQELNRIYGQAVAHWEVVIDDPFVVEADQVPGPDEGNSGILASFPQKMRQFNRAFKRSRNIDKDAYYVFLVPESSSSRAGFMPFKQQFGYIFTDQASQLSKTIAHELGHGAFRLRHTFSEFGLAQGTTDNLMDYSEGTKLYKYQWDNVHDPEAMVGWLQADEESALYDYCDVIIRDKLNIIHKANLEQDNYLDFYWSKEDLACVRFDLFIHKDLKIDLIEFTFPAKRYGGNIEFNPSKFRTRRVKKLNDYEGDYTIFEFGDFEFEDNNRIMMSFNVPTYQADELRYFLTGEENNIAETVGDKVLNTKLTKENYQEAARKLGVETEAVMAFAKVESRGNGFLEDGRPKILFEGHKFYKHLKKLYVNPENYRQGNENIIYRYSELKSMDPKPYKGGIKEYERMDKAKKINEEAALLSASYGAFQIMGENYKMCGYSNVYEFVEAMKSSKAQLMAFISFAESAGITKYLKEKNWQEVAKRYNGPDYKKNKYDEKFASAYEKYKTKKNE